MPGRRAERALPGSVALVEQPPWPFCFHAGPCGWSSSGAGRSGCETQALHLLRRAGTGQGWAGSHRHFRGCRAPSRRSCLGKAGRRLQEGCRPRWQCDSVGWAPPAQPLPRRWQQPQPVCWSPGKGGCVQGGGLMSPQRGWQEVTLILILIIPITGCPEWELCGPAAGRRRRRSRGCNQATLPRGPSELVCSGAGRCFCSVTWKWLCVPWGASPGWDGGKELSARGGLGSRAAPLCRYHGSVKQLESPGEGRWQELGFYLKCNLLADSCRDLWQCPSMLEMWEAHVQGDLEGHHLCRERLSAQGCPA